MSLAERGRMIHLRHDQIREAHTWPRVRVVPSNNDFRRLMVHPMTPEVLFPERGGTSWPLDAFTRRRIRDGSVTLESPAEARGVFAPRETTRRTPAEIAAWRARRAAQRTPPTPQRPPQPPQARPQPPTLPQPPTRIMRPPPPRPPSTAPRPMAAPGQPQAAPQQPPLSARPTTAPARPGTTPPRNLN